MVYLFECDLCDANYVGYSTFTRHLHVQCISEHRYSAIRKHLIMKHGLDKEEPIDHLHVLYDSNSTLFLGKGLVCGKGGQKILFSKVFFFFFASVTSLYFYRC